MRFAILRATAVLKKNARSGKDRAFQRIRSKREDSEISPRASPQ